MPTGTLSMKVPSMGQTCSEEPEGRKVQSYQCLKLFLSASVLEISSYFLWQQHPRESEAVPICLETLVSLDHELLNLLNTVSKCE